MSEPDSERDAPHGDGDRLFDATVRRMLKTHPKPHEEMKLGKPRRKGGTHEERRPSTEEAKRD
jgi:hypothetical protein